MQIWVLYFDWIDTACQISFAFLNYFWASALVRFFKTSSTIGSANSRVYSLHSAGHLGHQLSPLVFIMGLKKWEFESMQIFSLCTDIIKDDVRNQEHDQKKFGSDLEGWTKWSEVSYETHRIF